MCFQHLSSRPPSAVGLLSAFSCATCCDVFPLFLPALPLPVCRMAVIGLKVPAGSDSQNVIEFQKNPRNASCPLPIFQGRVYARALFFRSFQVSTFNPIPGPFFLLLLRTSFGNTHMLKESMSKKRLVTLNKTQSQIRKWAARNGEKWKRLWGLLKPVDFSKQKPSEQCLLF